ncbi:MAG: hypothetical protein IPM88_14935 [Nitrospira sp.]|nr:hypothetical protein [Nitrospira sp.]
MMFMGIGLVDFAGLPLIDLWEGGAWWDAIQWVPEIHASNEAFGAHLSLYGALYPFAVDLWFKFDGAVVFGRAPHSLAGKAWGYLFALCIERRHC